MSYSSWIRKMLMLLSQKTKTDLLTFLTNFDSVMNKSLVELSKRLRIWQKIEYLKTIMDKRCKFCKSKTWSSDTYSFKFNNLSLLTRSFSYSFSFAAFNSNFEYREIKKNRFFVPSLFLSNILKGHFCSVPHIEWAEISMIYHIQLLRHSVI